MSGDWLPLIDIALIEPGDITEVEAHGRRFAVYDTDAGITVSDVRCSHAGANLCLGYFDGKRVECPLHQGLFDARTGAAVAAPALRPLKMFETRVLGTELQIRLTQR